MYNALWSKVFNFGSWRIRWTEKEKEGNICKRRMAKEKHIWKMKIFFEVGEEKNGEKRRKILHSIASSSKICFLTTPQIPSAKEFNLNLRLWFNHWCVPNSKLLWKNHIHRENQFPGWGNRSHEQGIENQRPKRQSFFTGSSWFKHIFGCINKVLCTAAPR